MKNYHFMLIMKPSFLKETLDYADGSHSTSTLPTWHYRQVKPDLAAPGACTCRFAHESVTTLFIWGKLQVNKKIIMKHRRTYPLFNSTHQETTCSVGLKTSFAGLILSKATELSIQSTHGAGGYSIASKLQLGALDREDSPAFSIFTVLLARLLHESPTIKSGRILASYAHKFG